MGSYGSCIGVWMSSWMEKGVCGYVGEWRENIYWWGGRVMLLYPCSSHSWHISGKCLSSARQQSESDMPPVLLRQLSPLVNLMWLMILECQCGKPEEADKSGLVIGWGMTYSEDIYDDIGGRLRATSSQIFTTCPFSLYTSLNCLFSPLPKLCCKAKP